MRLATTVFGALLVTLNACGDDAGAGTDTSTADTSPADADAADSLRPDSEGDTTTADTVSGDSESPDTAAGDTVDPDTSAEDTATDTMTADTAPTFANVCGSANEANPASALCPDGMLVESVVFASYGNPEGSCGSFTQGTCHAADSQAKVEAACLGARGCSVTGRNEDFGGDPCSGTRKSIAFEVRCSTDAPPVERTCGTAPEMGAVGLGCANGEVITAVTFASFGTPTGDCGAFELGACHAADSRSRVEAACLGKTQCWLSANLGLSDPCFGTGKWFAVEVTCGP